MHVILSVRTSVVHFFLQPTLQIAMTNTSLSLMETRTASIVQGSALEPDRTKHGM